MYIKPLVNEDSETAASRGSSFYAAPSPNVALGAELVRVAKRRNEISAPTSTTIMYTTSSTTATLWVSHLVETLKEKQHEAINGLEKWEENAWIVTPRFLERYRLIQVATYGSSEQTSRQRERSVSELIADVGANSDIHFGRRLAARLEGLVEICKEEFPEQEPMSPRSLADFLTFVVSVSNINYPDVVLTYEGNIRAEWTKSRNKHFAVEFLGDNDVGFVVFAPDPKKLDTTNQASGSSTLYSLMEKVHPYRVLDWVAAGSNEKAA